MVVNNPYFLKDGDGDYYNKYPEFQIWEEGKQSGRKEVVEFIESHPYMDGTFLIRQAQLEEWLNEKKPITKTEG